MKMLRMTSVIGRFSMKLCAGSTPNRTNHVLISPITAYNHAKRYRSSSSGDTSKSDDASLNEEFDFDSESPYTAVDLEAVAEGDAEKLKALKVLQLEIELMRQQGERVPTRLSIPRWKDLLLLDSLPTRMKYLNHLWTIERKQEHRREKTQQRAEAQALFKASLVDGPELRTTSSPLNYKLSETTLFHRIRDCTMNQFYNYRLLMAEWFGPKIVVDCGYEQFMNLQNTQSCVKQMMLMWADNRDNGNPYDIVYCNVDKASSLWERFIQRIPMINDADSPVHFTEQHYLDMFPREKLVYLTPHCREILDEYSHDDIYIIGAYVDSHQSQPISLAKAKKEKLRMAKLPLDKYLHWSTGHKSLPINQVLSILNDLKDGLPWQAALKHVPSRKIVNDHLHYREDEDKVSRHTARSIRQNYQKNLVYDLLLNDRSAKGSKKR